MEISLNVSKKFITWASTTGAAVLAIIVSSYFVCDRMNADASIKYNQKFDIRYMTVHAPCEQRGIQLEKKVGKIDATQKNQGLALKILVMASRQRMTWEQKQAIVDELVREDSIPYNEAYGLLDQPLLLRKH